MQGEDDTANGCGCCYGLFGGYFGCFVGASAGIYASIEIAKQFSSIFPSNFQILATLFASILGVVITGAAVIAGWVFFNCACNLCCYVCQGCPSDEDEEHSYQRYSI